MAAVEFVPARQPEAIKMDSSKFKIINPEENISDASFNEDASMESDEDASLIKKEALTSFSKGKSSKTKVSKDFFDINESSNDRGTREPHRIHKSWPVNYHNKSTVGLENHGVTCYQNAAIQALLHIPAMGWYLLEVLKGKHPQLPKNSVTEVFATLFKKLIDTKRDAVYPRKLIQRLDDINPMLTAWNQEDSHEYYMSLISRLQEDSVPKGEKLNSSIICDMFGGSVNQRVKCSKCKSVSETSQHFYDLPVSFSSKEQKVLKDANGDYKPHYTLKQSIKDFFTPEAIEPSANSSGYQCEKCKTTTKAIKKIAIKDAPEYLTVHIKRFKMENQSSKKVKDAMHYPIELDLSNYQVDKSKSKLRYKLLSVIVHEGRTLSCGHYIAYAMQPNGKWYIYDDETKAKVSEKEAAEQSSAYILVYSRLLARDSKKQSKKSNEPSSGESRTPTSTKRFSTMDIDNIFNKKRKVR